MKPTPTKRVSYIAAVIGPFYSFVSLNISKTRLAIIFSQGRSLIGFLAEYVIFIQLTNYEGLFYLRHPVYICNCILYVYMIIFIVFKIIQNISNINQGGVSFKQIFSRIKQTWSKRVDYILYRSHDWLVLFTYFLKYLEN